MKQTEAQIIKIAEKVMEDIGWPYDSKRGIIPISFTIETQIEEMSSQKNHPRFQEYVDKLFPYWKAMLDFPEEEGWHDRNVMIISIKDEDGIAYEIRHRQSKLQLLKDAKGKYYKIEY